MRAPTQFTLTSQVPASVGVATFLIADAQGLRQQLAVPSRVTVEHPTDPARGPWQVGYRIDHPAQPNPIFLGETATVADPSATLSVGFALSQSGAAAQPPAAAFGAQALPPDLPLSISLAFAMQTQQKSQWGWAAVAASVAGYYRSATGPGLTQCALANWALGRTDCCTGSGVADMACNQPYSVQDALRYVGNLGVATLSGLSFDAVRAELFAHRPIVAIIQWDTGGRHAVVISGFDANAGRQLIKVQDCFDASTKIYDFSRFPAIGAWYATCTTVPSPN